ncbi:hypothetical protein BDZ89DRAFT_1166332 [Hymenopellis radicata]|nr:hypothetical protein BDZ89DRAFT_1166332 [Hymenopellis radicata]
MSQRWPLYRQPSPYAAYIAGDAPLDSPELFSLRDDLKAFLYELIDEADLHQETIDILHQVLAAAESEHDTTPHGAAVEMILRAALTAAESELAAATACCDAHASILPTPIHILPLAVMTKIFHLVVPPLSRGPWWLMHVCRRWRVMVTSCPTLWASFSIPRPYYIPHDTFVNEEPLLRALEYSRSEPLAFYAPIRHLPSGLLHELLLSSQRWKNVSLDQCMALDLGEALILPNLETLRLCHFDSARFTPVILDRFTQAPSLRKLTLGGKAAHPTQGSFPRDIDMLRQVTSNFPWRQITDLSVSLDYSWMSYLFVSACPDVVSFRDNSRGDSWEDREDWPVIALGQLRVLHSRNTGLLRRLTCPRLDKLSLPTGCDLVGETPFLGRTSPNGESGPKHIVLEIDSSSRNDVAELLSHLNDPCVTDLTLRSTWISMEMTHIIYFLASKSHIFPNLVRLHIQLEHSQRSCQDNDFQAMFLERPVYELRIRNSWKVHTVCVDVFCTGMTVPPCIDKFFSDLRESSATYKLSTLLTGWKANHSSKPPSFLDA